MKYVYHYSYEYIYEGGRYYGDGIATTSEKVCSDTYDNLKKEIFNSIDDKGEKIKDYKELHIISISLLHTL